MPAQSMAVLLLAAAMTCLASDPTPEALAQSRYDQILNEVREEPSLSPAALDLFRAVAEYRAEDVTADAAVQFGFDAAEFKQRNYKSIAYRWPAFRAIGKLGTPEAVAYLKALQEADFGNGENELWRTVQQTVQDLILDQIPSEPEKASYLEGVIREHGVPGGSYYLTDWASARLCETGMLSSFPVVDQFLRTRDSLRGAENAGFCEARMRTLASAPDRITALGSVLQVRTVVADEKLTLWAIRALIAMESPRADEIMTGYEEQVLNLPDGSPQKRELMRYADAIYYRNDTIRAARPAR